MTDLKVNESRPNGSLDGLETLPGVASSVPEIGVYEQAARSAKGGYCLFPAYVTKGENGKKNVRPAGLWRNMSSSSGPDIAAWWSEMGDHRNASVCIDTGKSGLVVVDCDGAEGIANWRALNPPATLVVATPGGGEHWYYAEDPRHLVSIDSSGKVAEHVDIRGAGGFVLAPPSSDWRGHYRVVENGHLGKANLPTVPAVVVERMKAKPVQEVPAAPLAEVDPDDDLFQPVQRDFTQTQAEKFIADARAKLAATTKGLNGAINDFALVCAHFPWLATRESVAQDMMRTIGEREGWAGPDAEDVGTINSAFRSIEQGTADDPWIAVQVAEPMAVQEERKPKTALRDMLLNLKQLRERPAAIPLIKGVLDLDSATWLIGQPGGFKSFVALDWACHVATGRTWNETHKVTQGDVLYVVAEGVRGFAKRVDAWAKKHNTEPERLHILPVPVIVRGQNGEISDRWFELRNLVREMRPALVVLDTQARMTVGMEENSNTEMGVWVQAVDMLKRAAEACVLVVHHTGRNGGDARGASALDGAQDAEWRVDRNKHELSCVLSMDKNKDGDDSLKWGFRLEPVVVGKDEDGEDITSLVLGERTTEVDRGVIGQMDLSNEEAKGLTLKELIKKVFAMHEVKDRGLTNPEVLSALNAWEAAADRPKSKKETVKTSLKRMVDGGELFALGAAKYSATEPQVKLSDPDDDSPFG